MSIIEEMQMGIFFSKSLPLNESGKLKVISRRKGTATKLPPPPTTATRDNCNLNGLSNPSLENCEGQCDMCVLKSCEKRFETSEIHGRIETLQMTV